MKEDFNVSQTRHARMHCNGKQCHCYGKICLVSEHGKGNCSAGNVFVNGRAFCFGQNSKFTLKFGKIICKELGFTDVVRVTNNQNIRE